MMKSSVVVFIAAISLTLVDRSHAGTVTVTVDGQTPGATPFINFLDVTVSDTDALKSVEFTIQPKTSSVTRAVSATYSRAYLQRRGYLNLQTGQVTVPIFGLYANYSNKVALTYSFKGHPTQRDTVTVPTAMFEDPTGVYTNPTVVQARSPRAKLSYDYVMLKSYAVSNSTAIMDTDGEVRWIGTANESSMPAIIFDNGIYISSGASVTRMEFDGTFGVVSNYSGMGITWTGHHNYDYGKSGILVEVSTTDSTECEIIEIDGSGTILKTWNLADIIDAAMTAGSDDPSVFVQRTADWFHNNACTYRKSDDSLIVSSRENFVISLDYETGAIKWILGDPTKAWYQYPSLRKFALTLGNDTLPPIGQHAVSITKDNHLLLFDDGANSQFQTPPGDSRGYSTPRKYLINDKKMTAKEVWNYTRDESIYSPFCSSVYEDRSRNYLIDYTLESSNTVTEILGLDSHRQIAFDYRYPALDFCATAWNAVPIHLEKMTFE